MDILKSCRLCIKGSNNIINMFDEVGLSENIAATIAQHFWFEVKDCDSFSRNICSNCWESVKTFHSFYLQVEHAHLEFYDNVRNKIKMEIIDNFPQEWQNDSKSEDEIYFKNSSDENNIVPDVPETVPEENSEASDTESEFSAYSSSSSDESYTCKRYPNKNKRKDIQRKKNLAIKKDLDIKIQGYYKMDCELCTTSFETFQKLREHFRTIHKRYWYIRCCNTMLHTRERLFDHMIIHSNPNAYKCEICDKIYVSKRSLADHMSKHVSNQEKPFKCIHCPKAFAKKYILTRHQSSHNAGKIFKCGECEKSFSEYVLLSAHKKDIHKEACNISAKVSTQSKTQCQLCGVWLKNKRNLRRHMAIHKESKETHICPQCGKKSTTRRALKIHIRMVHSKVTHKCTLCDKSYKLPKTLKDHMAAHRGEKLYKCPFCSRGFSGSGNMYSHKKKIHPIEWAEEKRRKASELG